jgi:hypothetical protein
VNNAHARFDLSDVVTDEAPIVDKVDVILDVATEVLRDYGSVVGDTRIERMAKWIVYSLGNDPCSSQAGMISRWNVCAEGRPTLTQFVDVYRVGEHVGISCGGIRPLVKLDPERARMLGTALFRAAEKAER